MHSEPSFETGVQRACEQAKEAPAQPLMYLVTSQLFSENVGVQRHERACDTRVWVSQPTLGYPGDNNRITM